jgi:hypothetical protein
MTILDKLLRNPLLRKRSAPEASGEPESAGGAQASPPADAPIPFDGYDDLDDREVVEGLSDHSQTELEAAESYEQGHEDRKPVLDKLGYMRGREPLPGYDALDVEEIKAALKEADLATIKKVRGYERKFANRPGVLEEVARVHRERREAQPEGDAPGYEPMSATSPESGSGSS